MTVPARPAVAGIPHDPNISMRSTMSDGGGATVVMRMAT